MNVEFNIIKLKIAGNGRLQGYTIEVIEYDFDNYDLPLLKDYELIRSSNSYYVNKHAELTTAQVFEEFKELFKYHMELYMETYKKL